MVRRQIPRAFVESLLSDPEQRIPQAERTEVVFQSRQKFEDGRIYLLRAIVNTEGNPAVVVTVYRTSKIDKYWSRK